MRFNENKVKTVLLYGAMPLAATFVAAETIPCMISNPITSLLFIPMYVLIADTYVKTFKRFKTI